MICDGPPISGNDVSKAGWSNTAEKLKRFIAIRCADAPRQAIATTTRAHLAGRGPLSHAADAQAAVSAAN